jgi:glycosyltransferase involved in cell wall biosynthesis
MFRIVASFSPGTAKHRPFSPRRILFLDHTAMMGGGEIALLNLLTHLDRKRFEPVALLFSDGPLVGRLREAGIECHVLPLDRNVISAKKDALGAGSLFQLGAVAAAGGFLLQLVSKIRSLRVELVHTNSLKSDLIGGIAARLAGLPLVWHVRDRISDDYLPGPVARIFRFLCRVIPSVVVTNSNATLQTISPASRPRNVFTVHDGTIVPGSVTPPVSPPRIGLVGRIAPWKGQDVFIRAAAQVARSFPEARFFIIGAALFNETEYDRKVRDLVELLAIGDRVTFTGFRSDVAKLIGDLTVLVHASTMAEPFGQVVIEGMAAAKPVVATRGGGVTEIVEEGRSGLLVPMSDVNAMAEAICRLLADPRQALEMGLRGRQRVIDHFTIQRTARRMEHVLRPLLAHRRRNRSAPSPSPAGIP